MDDKNEKIAAAVEALYGFIDAQNSLTAQACDGCGKCCDFKDYGHRLYVSTPELAYLESKIGKLKWAGEMVCPWHIEGRCHIHDFRFAGCRIFFCRGQADRQAELSEQALKQLKRICEEFDIPYEYKELSAALRDR